MPELWPFALYALAVARATLLITTDALLAEPRARLLTLLTPDDQDHEPIPVAWWRNKLAYLLTCIWCVPIWVVVLVAWPAWHWHRDNIAVEATVTVLALAMVASLLAKVGRDD